MSKKYLRTFAVLAFWLTVWQVTAMLIARPLLLPTPLAVAAELARLCCEGTFWLTILASLLRVLSGVAAAALCGVLLAIAGRCSNLADALLSPVMTLIKTTPVASFVILVLVWFRRDAVPAFISALIVLPVVWTNVSAGIRAVAPSQLELAHVFSLPHGRVLRRIYIPSVLPYFLTACRSALAFGWKAGIAAEVLTLPSLSIGRRIYEAKLYLRTEELFAWTAALILLSLLIEKSMVYLLERLCRVKGGAADADA